jgi:hypothetical protein
VRGAPDHLYGRPLLILGSRDVLAQSADDVLDDDDRVVHQHAQRDREAAQRHRVEGRAERLQRQHGCQHRQRQRNQRDDGGAYRDQECEHDQHDQHRAVAQRRRQVRDRALDEVGLSEDVRLERHALRQFLRERRKGRVELPRQHQRVGARLFLDREDHRRPAVVRAQAAHRAAAERDPAQVAHEDRLAAAGRHRHRADIFDILQSCESLDHVLAVLLRVEAGRDVLVAGPQRCQHLVDADPIRQQPGGIERDLVLTVLATDGHHLGDPGHAEQASLHAHIGDALEFDARVAIADQRREQDLAHHRGRRRHLRRIEFRRQRAAGQLQPLVDGLPRDQQVLAPAEFHGHHRQADARQRAHAAHASRPIQRCLDRKGDQLLDFERRHSPGIRDHGHRRRGEIGKHVDRHPQRGPGADGQQQPREREHEDPRAQCAINDACDHCGALSARGRGRSRPIRWTRGAPAGLRA